MNPEFNIDTFLEQNMPSVEDVEIPITLPTEHALPLSVFLIARVRLKNKGFQAGDVDPSQRTMDLEDNIAIIAERIDRAIGEEYRPTVDLAISTRQRDDLGYELVKNTHTSGRQRFSMAFRKPVYDAFLLLDDLPIEDGGKKNDELRHEIDGVVASLRRDK